jgi:hypothetical protein
MRPPRHPLLPALFAVALLAAPQAAIAQVAIPDLETADPPTRARLEAIENEAGASGWDALSAPLRSAALRAYGRDRFIAADAWFHLYRWSALFSEPESRFVGGWTNAIVANGVNYTEVAGNYQPSDRPIGTNLSQEMQAWLLRNEAFSQEFFAIITDMDYLPRVFATLEGLHRRGADKFEKYSSLALAIAVVYDVPPPSTWPHFQVTAQALPRKMPNAAETYEWLIHEDMQGRTYHRLSRLPAEELKFVVDIAAPVTELAWSQRNVPYPLSQFENVYAMVKYRMDRANSDTKWIWTGHPYTLPAILAEGGICVDQAYFAAEAGKARGVPTLLFGGSGNDGRHAWFGYLDGQDRWRLDAGRYAEQRFVTGVALDPQTWKPISDHELGFLSERFRALPSFKQSLVHLEFALDFLQAGNAAAAARAARSAANYEGRNLDAWEVLLAADAKLGLEPAKQEAVLREAALAFNPRYPDLVVWYVNRICQSLRARGEGSLADFEERGLAERLSGNRTDLATRQAATILARSIAKDSVADQISAYNATIAQFGHGAGTMFFDQIVVGFVEHLAELHMKPQAREAVDRAAWILDVQPGTQLAMEVEKLRSKLQD